MDSYKMKCRCRICGKEHEMTAWNAVNVKKHPELKQKVLDTSLFEYRCPDCGFVSGILYNCLYHDPDEKIMIALTEEQVENAFDDSEKENVITKDTYREYRLRTVHMPNDMVEKILIFENGFDDRAVEIQKLAVKVSLMMDHEDLDITALYFSINESGFSFVVETDEGFIGEVPCNEEMYRAVERDMLKKMTAEQARQTLINEDWAVNCMKASKMMN